MLYAIASTDHVIRLGALAGAFMAIVGAIALVARFSVKQFVRAVKDEMENTVSPQIEKVYANTMELKPNGGGSIADVVHRLEASIREIRHEQRLQSSELRRQHEKLETHQQAMIQHLADHRNL